jgi:DNA-binding transcriptional LysR family regulator
MDRLSAMKVFVEVVERGSLSAAAERLDMSRAMVSRYLAELEGWMGARLLHRSTRRLSLTAAGGEALARSRHLLELAEELQHAVATPQDSPRGVLRLTCSMFLAQVFIARVVTDYVKRYPAAGVDLLVLDRTVDLVEERIDLAIRISNDLDPNLIARKFGSCRSVICAAPSYLRDHGTPTRAEQLALHNCLTYSYFGKSLWEFEYQGQAISVPVSGNVSANESNVLLQAARNGAGVTMQPLYAAAPLIQSGELVALLPHYRAREMGIYGVYASRKQMPASLRAMLDHLADAFARDALWQVDSA